MYGRHIEIRTAVDECMICKEIEQLVVVDTSEGEYLTFDCCPKCFTGLLKGGPSAI